MSDGKIAPMELERIRRMAATQHHAYVDSLLGHIAALEKERDAAVTKSVRDERFRDEAIAAREEMKGAADAATRERDDWKRKAGERASFALVEVKKREAAESERDAALADSAAKDKAMGPIVAQVCAVFESHHAPSYCALGINLRVADGEALLAAAEPHPGAALLDEHRKALESEVSARNNMLAKLGEVLREHGATNTAGFLGVLNGIERVVVRARNEGLEKAAKACETHGSVAQGWATVAEAARRIRAMKEPE